MELNYNPIRREQELIDYNIQYENGRNECIGGHGGGEYDPQETQERLDKLMTVGNSMIWYVALLPLFGLVFEIYAAGKFLGYFLWGLIIAVRIIVCIYDNKKLKAMGLWDPTSSSWLVLLPVMYIIARSQKLKRSFMPVGIAAGCMVLAILNNGFTEAMTYNENNYYTFVSESYASYIYDLPYYENYVYNPYLTIDGMLNRYCIPTSGKLTEDAFISYEYENVDSEHYVTASAMKDGKKLAIVFWIDYDGYYFGGVDIDEITLDGKPVEGEQRDQMLRDIFMLELTE